MFFNTIINESNENLLVNVPDVEYQHETSYEGMLHSILETEQNYNAMMEAVAMDELSYFAEAGEEQPSGEGKVKKFFDMVIKFFEKIWQKIKGYFQKFFNWTTMLIRDNQKFLITIKKQLKGISDVEYKGYNYTNFDKNVATLYDQSVNKIPDISVTTLDKKFLYTTIETTYVKDEVAGFIEDMKDNFETHMNTTRGVYVGKANCDRGDYSKELFKFFRDDKSDVAKVKYNLSDLFEMISNAKEIKADAEEDMKGLNKKINEIIKELQKARNTLLTIIKKDESTKANLKALNLSIKVTKEQLSIAQQFSAAKVSAIKQRTHQAKAACVKAANKGIDDDYKAKYPKKEKESTNESAYGVNFI